MSGSGLGSGRGGVGLGLALASAASFGVSGTLASSLNAIGWTPGAAVTVRIGIAALALTPAALWQLRGRWSTLGRSWPTVLLYGLLAVAGAQLFFFNAVTHLSVGVALLMEYLGTILVVGWMWLRHGQRPRRLTVAGAAVAIVGLVFVLDLLGSQRLDPVGVAWGLGAAVGLAAYFLLSSRVDGALPGLVLAWAGLAVGFTGLAIADVTRLLPFRVRFAPVRLAGASVSWIVPVLGLSLVAAAFAYVIGIAAARLLGAQVASFVGLFEVVAAVLFAWLLLGQVPTVLQLLGGLLIMGGVVLVKLDEMHAAGSRPTAVEPLPVQEPAR